MLTRLVVLAGFESIKIFTGYKLDGKFIDVFPGGISDFERCEPVYEELPGWDKPTASVTRLEDLPDAALSCVKRIEELTHSSANIISTGPYLSLILF